jgi:hypothetical protein
MVSVKEFIAMFAESQLREAADAVVGVRISVLSREPKEKNDEGSCRNVLIICDFGLCRI